MILPTGKRGIRFRPALTVTTSELDDAVDAVERVLARET
jgi:L-lysine 6-transaminase